MKNYLNALDPRKRAQRERLTPDQVQNNAGGYVFRVSDEGRFLRFLILGTEGGTYYASERVQTVQEAGFVQAYAHVSGLRAVELILDVARLGRAPKPGPSLLALACVAKLGDLDARKAAWAALPELARTGTMLLNFLAYAHSLGGWGRLTRQGVARVYESLPLDKLALWAVKYKSRDGWSHKDALRLAHPRSADEARNAILRFMVSGALDGATDPALRLIEGHLLALQVTQDAEAARLMAEYGLPIEAVPTGARGVAVYRAAMRTNGLTWLLRNLGNLSRVGLLTPANGDIVREVVNRLTDAGALKRGRIHPLDALKAMLVYGQGRGVRGGGEWGVVPQVVDALQDAFYLAFGAVQPAGKRFLLGLDVSGSMDGGAVGGVPGLTPRLGTAAMSLVTARTEPAYTALAFSAASGGYGGQWGGGESGLTPLTISPRQRLDDVARAMSRVPMGGTDCALPMLWAARNKVPVDVFVIYTDNETWAGKVHPSVALEQYRQRMGIAARLAVVGMTATQFSVADPNDAGMLDLVGFDASAPHVLGAFARGEF